MLWYRASAHQPAAWKPHTDDSADQGLLGSHKLQSPWQTHRPPAQLVSGLRHWLHWARAAAQGPVQTAPSQAAVRAQSLHHKLAATIVQPQAAQAMSTRHNATQPVTGHAPLTSQQRMRGPRH